MKQTLIALLAFISSLTAHSQTLDVDAEISYCHRQVERTLQQLVPPDFSMTPRNIGADETHWNLCSVKTPEEWCAGFFPGILWMCGKNEEAARYTDKLE